MVEIEDNELSFLASLRAYENLWVAIITSEGIDTVIGSGHDAVQAKSDAASKGYDEVVLMKVPSFKASFIPLGAM